MASAVSSIAKLTNELLKFNLHFTHSDNYESILRDDPESTTLTVIKYGTVNNQLREADPEIVLNNLKRMYPRTTVELVKVS